MTDRFVVNMEHKDFADISMLAFPPEKDCMDDYIKEKKMYKKRKKQKKRKRRARKKSIN